MSLSLNHDHHLSHITSPFTCWHLTKPSPWGFKKSVIPPMLTKIPITIPESNMIRCWGHFHIDCLCRGHKVRVMLWRQRTDERDRKKQSSVCDRNRDDAQRIEEGWTKDLLWLYRGQESFRESRRKWYDNIVRIILGEQRHPLHLLMLCLTWLKERHNDTGQDQTPVIKDKNRKD